MRSIMLQRLQRHLESGFKLQYFQPLVILHPQSFSAVVRVDSAALFPLRQFTLQRFDSLKEVSA
jgi:hypothetical protein